MKHMWQLLAVGSVLAAAGCAQDVTPVSPKEDGVPASIVVPDMRGADAGRFQLDPDGSSRIITDQPVGGDDGSGDCGSCGCGTCGGGGGGGGSGGADTTGRIRIAAFTEAHFEADQFKGHAEMTYTLGDHALQDMTLQTSRLDGSTLGSYKFSTGKTWPLPVPTPQTMTTNGTILAPQCDGRGFGATVHEVWSSWIGRMYGAKENSQSTIMYQAKCQSTPGSQTRTDTSAGAGGYLRICLRLDHYSSTGQYVYTETVYCYDVNAT